MERNGTDGTQGFIAMRYKFNQHDRFSIRVFDLILRTPEAWHRPEVIARIARDSGIYSTKTALVDITRTIKKKLNILQTTIGFPRLFEDLTPIEQLEILCAKK